MTCVRSTTVSFTGPYGVTMAVPTNAIGLYATIKAEQLAALLGLIADARSGFQIELKDDDLVTFETLASELAEVSKCIVSSIVCDAEGGGFVPEKEAA